MSNLHRPEAEQEALGSVNNPRGFSDVIGEVLTHFAQGKMEEYGWSIDQARSVVGSANIMNIGARYAAAESGAGANPYDHIKSA